MAAALALAFSPVSAATITGELSGSTVLNEGSSGDWRYSIDWTSGSGADHLHSGDFIFDFGDGAIGPYSFFHFGAIPTKRHAYRDQGSYFLTVSGTVSLGDHRSFVHEHCGGFLGTNCFDHIHHFDVVVDSNVAAPTLSMTIQVLNVAPTVREILAPAEVRLGEVFDFSATAFDPGALDVLTFAWDLDEDGDFDDWTGASGTYAFPHASLHTISVQVDDGDGGVGFQSFQIEVSDIPEPAALGLLGLGLAGLGLMRRRGT